MHHSTQDVRTYFQKEFNHANDLIIHTLSWNHKPIHIVYLITLVNEQSIQDGVLTPLKHTAKGEFLQTITLGQMQITCLLEQAVDALLRGYCVIYFDDDADLYLFHTPSSYQRSITEPVNEKVLGNSHEGFIERLDINLHLIRKKITSQHLAIRYAHVGLEADTKLAIVYMDQLANLEIVEEINKRIAEISIDYISSVGIVEQFIEDAPYSPFPQVLSTERVDRVSANLMEGRIALLADGSSNAIILPVSFFAFYQSPDDYNLRILNGSFFRLLRVSSFFIAITLPAIYIAVVSFHFETIPNELVLPMQNAVLDIPFPPIMEAMLMELTVELIREAGLRLHSAVGQTIGVVGGLVIGDAIVRVGLVSNIMIVVVALTAISSFVVPSYEFRETLRILRFPIMILAASFGFLGIAFGLSILLIHMCKLEVLGIPYFYPLSPLNWKGMKDTFIRMSIWQMNQRPQDSKPQKKWRNLWLRGSVKHGRNKK
ncbi:spore germination protein [Paenibacillus marchantiophytorum]|nr:spore germination protein [Paenibacillus marchantiophytorum]